MAGSNPDFNAAEFRTAIQFVYDMAAPPVEEERATFLFPSTLVYDNSTVVSADSVPFDPDKTVISVPSPSKQVACGVEYFDARGNPTNFGTITPARAVVTLLDEDYAKIKGFTYVVLRGEQYEYDRTEYPKGLFDVGLYSIHVTAVSAR